LVLSLLPAGVSCSSPPADDDARTRPREDREIAFPSDALSLVGTLSLPERKDGESVPAVVLIHGSGPLDRDEVLEGQLAMSFGFEIPVFHLLARTLQASGMAVIRYDKRSCGRFNGCADNDYPAPSENVTVEDFLNDVMAAVDHLQSLPEIDPMRVSLIGHSEGGAFVIPVMAERTELRSGVMLAAPFKPFDAIIDDQTEFLRTLLEEAGYTPSEIEEALSPLVELQAALAEIRAGTYTGGAVGGAFEPLWSSVMELGDANPTVSGRIDRPLLAIGGSYDWNVPPSELDAWSTNFESSANSEERETIALDCMTHALNCVSEPDYTMLEESDIGTTLHPELTRVITTFLDDH
jgi:dienelactone hydrolase